MTHSPEILKESLDLIGFLMVTPRLIQMSVWQSLKDSALMPLAIVNEIFHRYPNLESHLRLARMLLRIIRVVLTVVCLWSYFYFRNDSQETPFVTFWLIVLLVIFTVLFIPIHYMLRLHAMAQTADRLANLQWLTLETALLYTGAVFIIVARIVGVYAAVTSP
jgi:hypothetical protein